MTLLMVDQKAKALQQLHHEGHLAVAVCFRPAEDQDAARKILNIYLSHLHLLVNVHYDDDPLLSTEGSDKLGQSREDSGTACVTHRL